MTSDFFYGKLVEWCKEYRKKYGTNPSYIYKSSFGVQMYTSEPDEEFYAEWNPVRYEREIGKESSKIEIKLHQDLMVLWNSSIFLEFNGIYKEYYIDINRVTEEIDILALLSQQGKYHNSFKIGNAEKDGNDELILIFDNQTGKIIVRDLDTNADEILCDSIEILLDNMEMVI